MNSFKKKIKKSKKKHDKKRKKDKKRRRRSSSSSSSSDSSSTSSSSSSNSSSDDKYKKRKHKKDRKRKRVEKKVVEDAKKLKTGESSKITTTIEQADEEDFSIPLNLMDSSHKAPETKEQYEKRQSVIRRVVDEETGRSRLVKGDGEIIEEMVSKNRHQEINKQATKSDGQNYSNKMLGWAVNSNKK